MGISPKTCLAGTLLALIWAALQSYVVLSVFWCWSRNGKVQGITLARGSLGNPPDEHMEVLEGETLIMNCSVSHYNSIEKVRWLRGKPGTPPTSEITTDFEVQTADSRVSLVVITENNHRIYSLNMTNVTASDYGFYTCSATWSGHHRFLWGSVYASVKNFPSESPICSTNVSDGTVANPDVWCDSKQGYPEVTITWTVESTNLELNGTLQQYTDGSEQERVRNVLNLYQLKQPNTNLVCTVTSTEFPGLNGTCNITVTVGLEPSPVTQSLTSVQTSTAALSRTDAPGSPGLSASTLVPAVVVPVLLVILPLSLICLCFIKQKRQDRGRDGDQPGRNPANEPGRCEGTDNAIIPYSVTTLQPYAMENTERPKASAGRNGHLSGESALEAPYERRPQPAKRFFGNTATKESNKTKDGQNLKGHHYSIPPDAGGNDYLNTIDHREDGQVAWEHVNTEHDEEVSDAVSNAPKHEQLPKHEPSPQNEMLPKHEAPYEVNLNSGFGSVSYTETPDLNAAGDRKGQLPKPDVPYYTIPTDDHDTHGHVINATHRDFAAYEHINPAATPYAVADTTATNDTPKKSRTARTIKRFAAKLRPTKQSHSPADKPEDGLMDNPLYQPLDGQSPMLGRGSVVATGEEVKLEPIENTEYLEII